MFLRPNRRLVDGEWYEYWTLVRTVRTAKGPRQEIVATLGKEPGLESRSRYGWESVSDLLEGRETSVQGELGEQLPEPPAQWAEVDLRGVRVERVREFGQVYLALSLWRRLGLHTLLRELIEGGREEVSREDAGRVRKVVLPMELLPSPLLDLIGDLAAQIGHEGAHGPDQGGEILLLPGRLFIARLAHYEYLGAVLLVEDPPGVEGDILPVVAVETEYVDPHPVVGGSDARGVHRNIGRG